MTASMEELAVVAYQSKWYEYDLSIRRCLALLLANYQKQQYFHGLNLFHLSLVTFARVNEGIIFKFQ